MIGGILLLSAAVWVVLWNRRSLARSRAIASIAASGLIVAAGSLLAVNLFAVPKPTAPEKELPSDPITPREKQYLTSLHRSTVEVFVDRPMFGMRRLLIPYQDVINAPKPLETNDQGSIVLPKIPQAVKKPANDKDPHFTFQDMVKDRLSGFQTEEKERWTVRNIQLVGLVKHPKPVVYDTAKVPGMKDAKDIPTRELDAFEKNALEILKSGENLHANRQGTLLRAMAPVYAGRQCAACHEKAGEMLGAFVYQLERVPVGKTKTP